MKHDQVAEMTLVPNTLHRIVFRGTIDNVVKKETTIGGKKSSDGTAELFVEDAGWHIVIGNLSIFVGHDEPEFKKGDKFKLIIEKENS